MQGTGSTVEPGEKMIKKFLTCAAVAAAAVALGAGSAAATDDEGHDRLVAAEKTSGTFEALRTSSGTGIYEGSLSHEAFISVTD
jgi:hypothetical protein